jgi:hypothetical protein
VLVAPANLAVVKAELLDPGRPQHLHRSTPASPAGASGPSTASSSNKPSRPTCMARSTRACSALAAANHLRPGPSGWSTRAGSAHPARQAPPPPGPPTRRGVSMTCSSRCRSRTAIGRWVASVPWRPPPCSRPRSPSRSSMSVSSRSAWPSASSRARNSASTKASKPGSQGQGPYFQSSRARTASAACRSVRPRRTPAPAPAPAAPVTTPAVPCREQLGELLISEQRASASRTRIARHLLGTPPRQPATSRQGSG